MAKKKKIATPNLLPPEVAEKIEVINWTGGHRQVFGRFGTVDLSTLTIQQAESLIARGFSKLKKRPVKAPKETEE